MTPAVPSGPASGGGSGHPRSWGRDLTLLIDADARFLPGAYGLINSALLNGFDGPVRLLTADPTVADRAVRHDRLTVEQYAAVPRLFPAANRLTLLPGVPDGKYLLLDADVIVERPLPDLASLLDAGLLVTADPGERYYLPYDATVARQARVIGAEPGRVDLSYLNVGVLGFVLPRDRWVMGEISRLCQAHLLGISRAHESEVFPFPEQDIMNWVVRSATAAGRTTPVVLSTRVVETGPPDPATARRSFTGDQRHAGPRDRRKYLIHGAGQRRPWLPPTRGGWLPAWVVRSGVTTLRYRRTPYERAWAAYACSDDLPIPLQAWADAHGFRMARAPVWRLTHGLPPFRSVRVPRDS